MMTDANSLKDRLLFWGFLASLVILPLINRPRALDRILLKDGVFIMLAALLAIVWAAFGLKRAVRAGRQVYWLLLFLLAVAASTWFSAQREISLVGEYRHWQGAGAYAALALVYFLALQVTWTQERLKTLLAMTVYAAALIAAAALIVFGYQMMSIGQITNAAKARGTLVAPNTFAFYLMIVYPLALRLVLRRENTGKEKVVFAIAASLIFAASARKMSQSVLLSNSGSSALPKVWM